MLTFGTTIVRFRFKRLPYGINSASKVFQKTVSSVVFDIEGSANSQDDIVIWEKTLAEHNNRLRKVLLKVRESGLRLNKNKVDPSKTDAITKMSVPQSLTELQRFLGMVNYLSKFIPNLAEVTAPLRVLLKKDVVFKLQKSQLDVIEKLKTLITSAPILKSFDSNLPTRLKTDASSEGLGALLE